MHTGQRQLQQLAPPHPAPQSAAALHHSPPIPSPVVDAPSPYVEISTPSGIPQAPPLLAHCKRTRPSPADGESSRRPRRDRGMNWNLHEMLVLVVAKREEFMDELDTVDARDLMDPDVTKWRRISDKVMAVGFSPCLRDHSMCKSKWHLLLPEYRRIADYHARIGTNKEVYRSQTSTEHVQEGLPKSFSKELYERIHEWFGKRPQIQPPHVRDLLNPRDNNFVPNEETCDDDVEVIEDNVGKAPLLSMQGSDSTTPPPDSVGAHSGLGKGIAATVASELAAAHHHRGSPYPPCPQPFLPRVSLVILSSSESGGSSGRRPPGSTGVRRHTLSGHVALAEATKAIGDSMVAQMQELVGANRESERNRLEVQLKLFAEKMQYQRDKDQRLYEQGRLAAQNATLAIMKQGELVQCLFAMSKVLSVGFMVSGKQDVHHGNAALPLATAHPAGCEVTAQRDRAWKLPAGAEET
jgi:hypothetical protein